MRFTGEQEVATERGAGRLETLNSRFLRTTDLGTCRWIKFKVVYATSRMPHRRSRNICVHLINYGFAGFLVFIRATTEREFESKVLFAISGLRLANSRNAACSEAHYGLLLGPNGQGRGPFNLFSSHCSSSIPFTGLPNSTNVQTILKAQPFKNNPKAFDHDVLA